MCFMQQLKKVTHFRLKRVVLQIKSKKCQRTLFELFCAANSPNMNLQRITLKFHVCVQKRIFWGKLERKSILQLF